MKVTLISGMTVLVDLASASVIPKPLEAGLVNLINATQLLDTQADLIQPEPINFKPCPGFGLTNNIFDIHGVTIDPRPIKKKRDVHIVAQGLVNKGIEQGATAQIKISRGSKNHVLDYDFCKGVLQPNGAFCPVEPGPIDWWTGQYMSKFIPKGSYDIEFKAFTKDGEVMSCITAPVEIVK